jgi:hypothetical protein
VGAQALHILTHLSLLHTLSYTHAPTHTYTHTHTHTHTPSHICVPVYLMPGFGFIAVSPSFFKCRTTAPLSRRAYLGGREEKETGRGGGGGEGGGRGTRDKEV